jgi:DNA-directed RNA polymerase subunit RPC12/RpoP
LPGEILREWFTCCSAHLPGVRIRNQEDIHTAHNHDESGPVLPGLDLIPPCKSRFSRYFRISFVQLRSIPAASNLEIDFYDFPKWPEKRRTFMTDRIKIICSKCRKPFSERANRLKNGFQVQCPNCMSLITFDSSSEDPNIRRPLKAARDIRYAAETALVMARMAAQEPKRDAGY